MDNEYKLFLADMLNVICAYFISYNLINCSEHIPFSNHQNTMKMYITSSGAFIKFKLQWGINLEKEDTILAHYLSGGIIYFKDQYLV